MHMYDDVIVQPLHTFNIKTLNTRHLYDKKSLRYHSQANLQHLLQNGLHIEYFTCNISKDMFSIDICGVLQI